MRKSKKKRIKSEVTFSYQDIDIETNSEAIVRPEERYTDDDLSKQNHCSCGGYLWNLGDYLKCGDCGKVYPNANKNNEV